MRGIDQRLTNKLKKYDRKLYAYRAPTGVTMIMREADRMEASDFHQEEEDPALLNPQFIFACTSDLSLRGQPQEWGIEPILNQLKGMDVWRDGSWLKERKVRIEREKADEERQQKNQIRAIAADARKDFAKATNDINTSTIEKIDNRRNYGNR